MSKPARFAGSHWGCWVVSSAHGQDNEREVDPRAFAHRVEPKELRNFRLVVRQVLVERRAHGHAGLLQLDDHQRQAVDEADRGEVRITKFSQFNNRNSAFDISY
ncbi:MAG: hypothetical protein EXS27_10100 [Pedosphaera sp.]|nr:hypothetical protein [Pedosphaera sp.]